MPLVPIIGINTDHAGRCAHWHSDADVVANKCAACQEFFACYHCHNALRDHTFAPMPLDQEAVMCGSCGYRMDYRAYNGRRACPGCGHSFNSGCQNHGYLYFDLGNT